MERTVKLYRFIVVLLIVALVFLWYVKSCTGDSRTSLATAQDSVNAKYVRIIDSLTAKANTLKKQDSIDNEFIKDLMLHKEQTESDLDNATEKLRMAAKKVITYNPIFWDTLRNDSNIRVYYGNSICDSLAKLALAYTDTVKQYQHISDSLQHSLVQQGKVKDSIIATIEKMRSACSNVVKDLNSLLDKAITVRRKVYLGAEGYSTQTAFQSLQVGALYQDKKGSFFGVSAGVQLSGQFIGGLKYYHIIQLHK